MANASWIDAEALEPDDDDNDMWHVLISEGEVKTVTLEQLDDFFRLDVIDVNTRVWGPDMTGWTTLGEALGIEADDDAEEISVVTDDFSLSSPHDRPTVKQSLPPPAFAPQGRGSLPRLVAVPEPDSRPRSFSPPPKLTPYAAVALEDYKGDVETVAKAYVPPPRLQPTYPPINSPKSTQPFGVAARPASPYGAASVPRAPALPSASVYPPVASASAYPPVAAPRSAFPAPYVPMDQPGASLRPQAIDIPTSTSRARRDSIRAFASDPDIYLPKPSRFGAWLMAAAVLAGAAVTLYRNDLIRDIAHRAGQDAAYARLEAALGGPAFGTPRSVEHPLQAAGMTGTSLGAQSLLPRAAEELGARAPKAEAATPAAVEAPRPEEKAQPSPTKAVAIDALPSDGAKAATSGAEAPRAAADLPAPIKKAAPTTEPVPRPAARMKATALAAPAPVKREAPAPKAVKAKAVEVDEPLPGMPPSLDDAIRDRATRPSKKKKDSSSAAPAPAPVKRKKSGGNDYDPLNSDL